MKVSICGRSTPLEQRIASLRYDGQRVKKKLPLQSLLTERQSTHYENTHYFLFSKSRSMQEENILRLICIIKFNSCAKEGYQF